ncbi:MAG TPA: hypothetical protein VNW97_11735 [Candidatus Saccharimonadales bacterium]|nr:hypothetical protein [Candidatus Saccharimonadales bacterium]
MSRIYIYKMTTDDGGAPCVRDGFLTLAICKPAIRRKAQPGDIIMAFAAKDIDGWRPKGSYRDNSLIYIAEVTTVIPNGEYYSSQKYKNRADCIYEWHGGTLRLRRDAKFHGTPATQKKDLGEKETGYKNASVILADKFKYFADQGPSPHEGAFGHLSKLIITLKQGSRVNHQSELLAEIYRFRQLAWEARPRFAATPIPKVRCLRSCDQDDAYVAPKC